MIRKRMVKGFILGCTLAISVSCWEAQKVSAKTNTVDTYAILVEKADGENGDRAAQLVWYYKEEDGKIYRRLYDSTNEVWVTEWILCE